MISLALSLALAPSGFCNSLQKCNLKLEAEVGIEPTNEAFAEPCLTTWLPRPPTSSYVVSEPVSSELLAPARLFHTDPKFSPLPPDIRPGDLPR